MWVPFLLTLCYALFQFCRKCDLWNTNIIWNIAFRFVDIKHERLDVNRGRRLISSNPNLDASWRVFKCFLTWISWIRFWVKICVVFWARTILDVQSFHFIFIMIRQWKVVLLVCIGENVNSLSLLFCPVIYKSFFVVCL